jgi:hypothetical protein
MPQAPTQKNLRSSWNAGRHSVQVSISAKSRKPAAFRPGLMTANLRLPTSTDDEGKIKMIKAPIFGTWQIAKTK